MSNHFTISAGAGILNNSTAPIPSQNAVTVLGGDACARRIVVTFLDGVDQQLTMGTAVADDGTVNITIARYYDYTLSPQSADSNTALDDSRQEPCDNGYEADDEENELDDDDNNCEAHMHCVSSPGHEYSTMSRHSSIWGLCDAMAEQDRLLDSWGTASSSCCSELFLQLNIRRQTARHQAWCPLDKEDIGNILDVRSDDKSSDGSAELSIDAASETLPLPPHAHTSAAFYINYSQFSEARILSWDGGDNIRRTKTYVRPTTPHRRNCADGLSEPSELSWDGGDRIRFLEALGLADTLPRDLKRAVAALEGQSSGEKSGCSLANTAHVAPPISSPLPVSEPW
ncbi:hypothetical protein T440DRAFT_523006 [Plenodomus tracheiphilus IPT5]|uniref:Uncharacterized protein n=1 Tax=Plenodomus tracheiphilus IPT5 TaxID=1408161 RepID=A0A6A7AP55_9PLEO|nr:hypothetical protein T440DRAFT_523006 [Plenodomus tracheiphilus IPT5]